MENRNAEWQELEARCRDCRACPLGQTRTNNVFGTGDTGASLMFVGEAPGEQEDKTGIPFVGAAGKLLDRYLYAVDLPRDKVYIANILKCRPPHNRDPEEGEQDACIGYLREQFRLIRPRVVVCLGRIAAMRLIRPDYRITREHGQWVQKGGVWMTAVYHPSALLRDLSKREDMLRDMWAIRQKLEELGVAPCVEDTANE
ncbi:MAG: uracil-DNA glycosylase [Ruminococcaceae bacterium]|nr:uracil-DNA glycosylase [Oscillospiraceae bacterium]